MLRFLLGASLLLTNGALASAQYSQGSYNSGFGAYQPAWAVSLMSAPRHDFGVVARGSDHTHVFEFVNPLQSEVVLSGVRASCGCASPTILTPRVKPGEKGQIQVKFNTLSFLGDRHARITATVSAPEFTELYMDIDGHVRRDIVVTPGQANFGTVMSGVSAEQALDIRYAGMGNWQVTSFECSNRNLDILLTETKREGMRIDYHLTVKILPTQPAGPIADQIILFTNDAVQKQFPITVSGYVKPLVETQAVVDVGSLQQGKPTVHRVVVKSEREFVVLSAEAAGSQIKIKPTTEKKRMHVLELEVVPDAEGRLDSDVVIQTDIQASPTTIHVSGQVLPAIQTKDNNQ